MTDYERFDYIRDLAKEYTTIWRDRENRERRKELDRELAAMTAAESLHFARQCDIPLAELPDFLTVLSNRARHANE